MIPLSYFVVALAHVFGLMIFGGGCVCFVAAHDLYREKDISFLAAVAMGLLLAGAPLFAAGIHYGIVDPSR